MEFHANERGLDAHLRKSLQEKFTTHPDLVVRSGLKESATVCR